MEHRPRYQLSISIHAAREGGDIVGKRNISLARISIHAAREGGDYITAKEGK